MLNDVGRCRKSGRAAVIAKHPVNSFEQRRDGAEREHQRHTPERLLGGLGALAKFGTGRGKHFRRRALETVDRLFFVSDREHRARAIAFLAHAIFTHAVARVKLADQLFDHAPLDRAGVLSFVNQDMVEPAVELVEDPGCGVRLIEQARGMRDEIVKIERGTLRFGAGIVRHNTLSDGEQRDRCVNDAAAAAQIVEPRKFAHSSEQRIGQPRFVGTRCLGDKRLLRARLAASSRNSAASASARGSTAVATDAACSATASF